MFSDVETVSEKLKTLKCATSLLTHLHYAQC